MKKVTMKFTTGRTVLRAADAEPEFTAYAERSGMRKLEEVSAPPGAGLVRELWWSAGQNAKVYLAMDDVSGCWFFTVEGGDQSDVEELSRRLHREFDVWENDALLEAIDEVAGVEGRHEAAILRAGLGAPLSFDEDVFDYLTDHFRDAEVGIRRAAVWAVSYSPWPEYLPLLREVARNDPDEDVRHNATLFIELITKREKGRDS